jgi:hypothetical protein
MTERMRQTIPARPSGTSDTFILTSMYNFSYFDIIVKTESNP